MNTSEGYARLVFRFEDEIEPDVKLANGIVVINFKRPVDVAVDRLNTNAPSYVAAARRDPDGKGVRIALSRKVRINTMLAGERLFVDLLPETWKAAPPGLPQAIVEELARRARDAERKLRQERPVVKKKLPIPIRVRVGQQPTFTRYVFELPDLVAITSNRAKEELTLSFGAPFKFDLADAKVSLPPMVETIDSDLVDDTTTVKFRLIGNVDVRAFREDNNYVVDIGTVGGRNRPADLAAPAAQAAAGGVAADAEGKSAQPVPAVEPPQTASPQPTPTKEPVAPVVRAADKAERPAVAKPDAKSEASAPPPPAATPAPTVTQAQALPRTAAEPSSVKNSAVAETAPAPKVPAGADAAPSSTPSATPAVVVEKRKDVPALAAERPRDPAAPVMAELRRQSDNILLTFPFATVTPAAIFRRADVLWLVFDSAVPIDVAALNADPTRTIRSASTSRSRHGQVVTIKLERPRLTSLNNEGAIWTVIVADSVLEPSKPLMVARNVGAARPTVIIPFEAPSQVHRIYDPEIGDTLLVVTALAPARGLLKTQNFVEFRVLASTHGIVLQPIADDVMVELTSDNVVIGRPGGLTLSSGMGTKRTNNFRPIVFDTQTWGFDREAPFVERYGDLLTKAAAAPEAGRAPPRLDLARFYLARDMYPEAKGVLDVTLGDQRATAETAAGLVLRAISNVMMGRPTEALKDLANPAVGNQHDAQLWRALAFAKLGKWAEAREGFRSVESAIGVLPVELQRLVLKEAVRAAIEVRDYGTATSLLNEFEVLGSPPELEPSIAVLKGQIAEGLEKKDEALASYRLAADSADRPSSSKARLLETTMRYRLGDLQRSDVIAELELLTTVWRGDETEVEALQLLARLYTEDGRFRDAFQVVRTALSAHPNSELTRKIQDEAATAFDALFLAGKGDAMPAIDALSLFYDFRELTPIGRRGDEMIRRLADRLVSVDLLDQAAELLQHQVDHRLQGAARAQVAARLAVVYLMNRKPDRALAALRTTRASELPNDLRNQRILIEARALSDVGRHDIALDIASNIEGREATRLKSDILWTARRWREAAEQVELLYGERWRDFEPLDATERLDLLRAAIGYALAEDTVGLGRFREKYAAKMAESPDARAFEAVTNSRGASAAEFREIARMVASVDTLEGFLREMRARYPESASASPSSIKPPASAPPADAGQPSSRPAGAADPTPTGSIEPRQGP